MIFSTTVLCETCRVTVEVTAWPEGVEDGIDCYGFDLLDPSHEGHDLSWIRS